MCGFGFSDLCFRVFVVLLVILILINKKYRQCPNKEEVLIYIYGLPPFVFSDLLSYFRKLVQFMGYHS